MSRRILQSFRHDINIANYPFYDNFPQHHQYASRSTTMNNHVQLTHLADLITVKTVTKKKRKGVNCAYLCKRIANFLKMGPSFKYSRPEHTLHENSSADGAKGWFLKCGLPARTCVSTLDEFFFFKLKIYLAVVLWSSIGFKCMGGVCVCVRG